MRRSERLASHRTGIISQPEDRTAALGTLSVLPPEIRRTIFLYHFANCLIDRPWQSIETRKIRGRSYTNAVPLLRTSRTIHHEAATYFVDMYWHTTHLYLGAIGQVRDEDLESKKAVALDLGTISEDLPRSVICYVGPPGSETKLSWDLLQKHVASIRHLVIYIDCCEPVRVHDWSDADLDRMRTLRTAYPPSALRDGLPRFPNLERVRFKLAEWSAYFFMTGCQLPPQQIDSSGMAWLFFMLTIGSIVRQMHPTTFAFEPSAMPGYHADHPDWNKLHDALAGTLASDDMEYQRDGLMFRPIRLSLR